MTSQSGHAMGSNTAPQWIFRRTHEVKNKTLLTAIATAGLLLMGAAPALAGGSDSPTPYTVDATGITLPDGETFRDNGHVNIKTTSGPANLHFEGKCVNRTDAECAGERHDAAQFIGKSFIPWSAFGLTSEHCVSWVQLSDYNEHYGEGAQPPVCLTVTEPPVVVDPPVEPEKCIVALWKAESASELWPQVLFASEPSEDCATFPEFPTECESQYQADIYLDDAITAALLVGGVLNSPENPDESWPGGEGYQSHFSRVWTTGECPPVVVDPPVEPPIVVDPPVDPPVTPPVTEEPPVTEPPVVTPPVTEPPVVTPPIEEPPVVVEEPVVVSPEEPEVVAPPVVTPPVVEKPVVATPATNAAPIESQALAATGVTEDNVGLFWVVSGISLTIGLGLIIIGRNMKPKKGDTDD